MVQRSYRNIKQVLENFLKAEASGGITLIVASALAILFANSMLAPFYDTLLHTNMGVTFNDRAFSKPFLFWVNDGLMVVFFFLVGLEIKREFMEGELASVRQATLPLIAAVAGIAAPALVFYWINLDTPENMKGWAIPAATDIAFALGLLALLGRRVPISLKVFLTAVAIIDDLAAILIIAFFYTGGIEWTMLSYAALFFIGLVALNRFGNTRVAGYIILGFGLWLFLKMAGIHPTLAGVLTALCIPLNKLDAYGHSPAKHLEHLLHPWVAFMILPIFGFSNAGVSFAGMTIDNLLDPLTLGIAAGLFFGKQIGIFSAAWFVIKMKWASLPKHATWVQTYAVCMICGIGFTMSLFIGGLAFTDPSYAAPVRLGVLAGSLASAIIGFLILRFAPVGPKFKSEKRKDRN